MAIRMRGSLHEYDQPGCARIFGFMPLMEWTILQAKKQ
jgi:hypothetical protein